MTQNRVRVKNTAFYEKKGLNLLFALSFCFTHILYILFYLHLFRERRPWIYVRT